MKEWKKYSGIVVLLIGVLVISVPLLLGLSNNPILASGLSLVVLGIIIYIVVNRRE